MSGLQQKPFICYKEKLTAECKVLHLIHFLLLSFFIVDLIIPPLRISLFVLVTKQRKYLFGIWHNCHYGQALHVSRHHVMARQQLVSIV